MLVEFLLDQNANTDRRDRHVRRTTDIGMCVEGGGVCVCVCERV